MQLRSNDILFYHLQDTVHSLVVSPGFATAKSILPGTVENRYKLR